MSTKARKQASGETRHTLPQLQFFDNEFVLNTESGLFYGLTPSACYLLQALDSGSTVQQFPALMRRRYRMGPAQAQRDVELLLNQFSAMGLLAAVASS